MTYFAPLLRSGSVPDGAHRLGGGWTWFTDGWHLSRDHAPVYGAAPDDVAMLTEARAPVARIDMNRPVVMGILNVTPDSFSDGGLHDSLPNATAVALAAAQAGAGLIDIGGESTRPGAEEVPVDEELRRTIPVIEALRKGGCTTPISIDTRKAEVADAAMRAGADMINDVSGMTFDPQMPAVAARHEAAVCIMHAQGLPADMQNDPRYDNVVLDVYDWLQARIDQAVAAGIPRHRIVADPGIGFGKTLDHNLVLMRHLSLFHGLGTALMLGVSRKGFIGQLGRAPNASDRAPGSIAAGLAGLAQGVHFLRVHDIEAHCQAFALWNSCTMEI